MDHDAMLVARCLKGDRKAFTELVSRHQRRIITVIYRTIGNRETALDLAQETFIRAYGALSAFDQQRRFSTWLNRIALNVAIDHLRINRNVDLSYDEESERQSLPESTDDIDPLHDLVKQERLQLVNRALLQLPVAYRIPLVLRFSQELSYAEIAEILVISVNTVKIRIHRGLQRLRETMESLTD